jgi:phosphate transport system permease protein
MPHRYADPVKRPAGWLGQQRGHRAKPIEWLIEKGIFLVSLWVIALVFLLFLFVGREALPIFLGRANSAAMQESLPVGELNRLLKEEPERLRRYLDVKTGQFEKLRVEAGHETLKILMQVKEEEAREAPKDQDARLNTTTWRYLLGAHQWSGYDKPEYIWQPISQIHKYNIVPLFLGSLKTTAVALLFAVPIALGAAIFVSQLGPARLKEWLKPAIELLAGIPSVVLGFFALIVMATLLQKLFGYQSRLNAFVAGIALGIAVIPVIFSIAEDAITSVPRAYTQAALALGATRWEATWQVVLPAALPGVFAAVVLGFGRAIGETMVVLMASGNASIVSSSLFDSTRTITATIAAELAEAVFGGHHYRVLFMLGTLLFAVTFCSNAVAGAVIHSLKQKLEGKLR